MEHFLQFLIASVVPTCTEYVTKTRSSHPKIPAPPEDDGKCELISTFSLITQALLGLLCLLCLIFKRFYEYPIRRTWHVWLFDVLKQIIGAMGLHVVNLCISVLKGKSKKSYVTEVLLQILANNKNPTVPTTPDNETNDDACDWYFLNITFDCTIGVFVFSLIFHLVNRILTDKFHVTHIESGQYGNNPRRPSFKSYFKQLGIYFGSLMTTKVILFYFIEIFANQLVWITNHFLLFWLTDYPDEFEIFIVMFVWPIFMNCLQLILIDNIIKSQWLLQTNEMLNHLHQDADDVRKAMNYGTFEGV